MKIMLKVEEIKTDPLQYKPYSPTLRADNLFVEVEVPGELSRLEKGDIILTTDGLAIMCKILATSIMKYNVYNK